MNPRALRFCLLAACPLASAAFAQTAYTLTDLGTLPGHARSTATGVNAAGQVVGVSLTEDFESIRGFVWANGTLTPIAPLPGGDGSFALAINATGQIAATSLDAIGNGRAFLYANGTATPLGTLGGPESYANAINATGQIVGESNTGTSSPDRAFLYANGRMSDLGTLGGTYARARAINDAGQIAGESGTAADASGFGSNHAFLYTNSRMTDLGTLGGYESWANALNASGVVVGGSHPEKRIPFGPVHAFRYANGTMTDLGTLPGFDSSEALAINAAGQIVGESYNYDDDVGLETWRAFLHTDGQMFALNDLLVGAPGWIVARASAITDTGLIAATAVSPSGQTRAVLLRPSTEPLPFAIRTQPASRHVNAGAPVTLTAAASGTGVTYQWLKNGVAIPGATNASLTLASTAAADMGFYSVLARSGADSIASAVAVLTVESPREFVFSTFAGSGRQGRNDGPAASADFWSPHGIAIDADGNVFVADSINHTIRKVSAAGVVTTLAGVPGSQGSTDGPAGSARLSFPTGLAIDAAGHIVVSDSSSLIRRIAPDGSVTTLARGFNFPRGVAVDATGHIFVADSNSNVVRRISPQGEVSIFAGAVGSRALVDGPGATARFVTPDGLAIDAQGNLIVTDSGNQTIRRISPQGVVTTVAGAVDQRGSADGPASAARFDSPLGVAVDRGGNIFIADFGNEAVRKITPDGMVTTVGGAAGQSATVNGLGSTARFVAPRGVAVDARGDLLIADGGGNVLRRGVAPGVSRLVNVSTRGFVPAGGDLTPGFVLRGTGSKQLVVRAVGPTLSRFGLPGALADARLDLIQQGVFTPLLTNNGWSTSANAPALASTTAAVGGFPLDANSKDAAVLTALSAATGTYTVRITPGTATASGIALAEIYDAEPLHAPVRLVNVSTIGFAGVGANALVPGFVIGGSQPKHLLIRAVGPGLAAFGATGVLADPQLAITPLGQLFTIASNDNWIDSAETRGAFAQAGAFPLAAGSRDAAVVLRLPPGGYTVQVAGANNSVGNALVEIYDLEP